MSEKNCGNLTSRREFLKKMCKTMGYVLPVVAAFKLGSRDAWAENYGKGNLEPRKHSNGKCDDTIEKIFNISCW